MNLSWEVISQTTNSDITQRLAVPGGWLICRLNGSHLPRNMASWFVSDPGHEWESIFAQYIDEEQFSVDKLLKDIK